MLEVDIPLLFILSMTLSMLGPSTRRHCACALGGILISEIIKLLVTLCDRGGVKSLGTLSWGQMQTRPKQSLIHPHVLTGSSTYHSITHWIASCLSCQFASHYQLFTLKRFPISHYTWWIQFTIQRMSNLALHFAGFLLSEKEEYCFKQLQTATLAS